MFARMNGPNVEIVTERVIYPDEDEIFVDYGKSYDRSSYGGKEDSEDFDLKRLRDEQKRLAEEQDMMKLQPIRADDANFDDSKVDADTTNRDGFISKLKDKERKYDQSGVINPAQAAKEFSELGVNMFGEDGDKELLESLMGKKSAGTSKPTSKVQDADDMFAANGKDMFDSVYSKGKSGDGNRGILDPKDAMDMFGGGGESSQQDKDILADLKAQLGSSAEEEEDIPDISQLQQQPKTSTTTISTTAEQSTKPAEPTLSKEEADDLQRRLDNLSDDQIEKVFAKMRGSLGAKMADEIGDAIKTNQNEMDDVIKKAKLEMQSKKEKKSLPRNEIDPELRKKYGKELTAIEDELEKMYNDPLGVWQELLTDPDKYLSEDQIKKIDEKMTDDELQ